MPVESIGILIVVLAHFAGLAVLVTMMMRADGVNWSSLWPNEDDDSDGGSEGPVSGPEGDGPLDPLGLRLPLDNGGPSSQRLREPHPVKPPRRVRRGPAEEPDKRPAAPHRSPR